MDIDVPEARGTKRPIDDTEGPRKPKKIRVSYYRPFLRKPTKI
jgi:hypothetical protein